MLCPISNGHPGVSGSVIPLKRARILMSIPDYVYVVQILPAVIPKLSIQIFYASFLIVK